MPLTRFKLSSIGDDGITSAKLAHDLDFDGTHIRVPHGTTAQRPGSAGAGAIRFNTTDSTLEQYNGSSWVGLASPPLVTAVSPTSTNGDSGTVITITGTNFTAESTVHFINNGGTSFAAGAVTYVSGSSITATFPQNFTVSDEPLDVKVTTSVGNSTLENSIDLGGVPAWSTAAGSIATGYKGDAISQTIVATDPEGGDVDYTLSSGSLPSGVTLNTETGVISGTLDTDMRNSTTYTANITPNDSVGNTAAARAFTITQNGDGDPNFKYVTSRLTMDGTNDSNNDITGASRVGNLTPTVLSGPHAGSFSPHHPDGYWSSSMRGGYDGYKIASTSNLTLGTSAYTLEFWMKETGDHSNSKARYMIQGQSGTTIMEFATDNSNDNLRFTTGSGTLLSLANFEATYGRGTWNHFAIVRQSTSSNQLFLYINGVYKDYSTDSGNHQAGNYHIGGLDWATDYCLEGYMSNYRLSNTARYTNSGSVGTQVFTPPTAPFTSDSNTLLLTCQSNRVIDNGPNANTIGFNNNNGTTAAGGPSLTCHSPFLTPSKRDTADLGSIFFEGSNDGLTYADNAAFQVGTGDFSWSFWVYMPWDAVSQSYWNAMASLNGVGYDENALACYMDESTAGAIYFDVNNTGGGFRSSSAFLPRGQWNYVEASRASGTFRFFLNGVQFATSTTSITFGSGNTHGLSVGYSDTAQNSGAGNFMREYIAEMRVVKGTAGNTSNYTPPTAPLTNVTNTTFLLNGADYMNVTDFTGFNNWHNHGTGSTIDTSDKKFGTGSLMLNTTNGSSTTNGRFRARDHKYKREFDFTGDWTIEFWWKGVTGNKAQDTQYRRLYDNGGNNGANALQILINITGGAYGNDGGAFIFDNGNLIANSQTTITGGGQQDICDNAWHHVRFVHDRSASLIYEYTDGTLYSTRATSGAKSWLASASGYHPTFGSDSTNSSSGRTVGRIDDVRIYNGYAVSTGSSYTVPAREKPIW
jgi:hypothetical protein